MRFGLVQLALQVCVTQINSPVRIGLVQLALQVCVTQINSLTHTIASWSWFPGELRIPGWPEGQRSSEMHCCANLLNTSAMGSLHYLLLNLLGLLGGLGRCLLFFSSRSFICCLFGHWLFALRLSLTCKKKYNEKLSKMILVIMILLQFIWVPVNFCRRLTTCNQKSTINDVQLFAHIKPDELNSNIIYLRSFLEPWCSDGVFEKKDLGKRKLNQLLYRK